MALPPPRARTRLQATTPATPEPQDPPLSRIRRQASAPVRQEVPATSTVDRIHRVNRAVVSSDSAVNHEPYVLPEGIEHAAYVRVESKATVQPAPYESISIGVSLSLPCAPNMPAIEQAFEAATQWVADKVTEQVQAARGQ